MRNTCGSHVDTAVEPVLFNASAFLGGSGDGTLGSAVPKQLCSQECTSLWGVNLINICKTVTFFFLL